MSCLVLEKIEELIKLSFFVKVLYKVLNYSNSIAAIFLDQRWAFEMVDHQILSQKLNNIGLKGSYFEKLSRK